MLDVLDAFETMSKRQPKVTFNVKARHPAARGRNALRNTGPRTDAGKARSRRNAFKHGLEVPINRDNVFAEQIEALATELSPLSAKPHEIVRLAAAWQLEVARVQATRVDIINRKRLPRQPNKPIAPRPAAKSGKVPGRGVGLGSTPRGVPKILKS